MSTPKIVIKDQDSNKVANQKRGKPLKERTKLHTRDIVYWLRKRYHKTNSNMNYLYFPEELQKHREVEKIFQRFDEDKSGKLGLGEFYKLMREAKIEIDLKDLRDFYEVVDDDQDVALDFREFKNCTLSEEANHHFGEMMRKVREASPPRELSHSPKHEKKIDLDFSATNPDDLDGEESGKQIKNQYMPRTFGNLLNYITYGNKKKEITEILKNDGLSYAERFEKFQELYDLKIGKDIYFAKYNEKFKAPGDRRPTKFETSFGGSKSIITERSIDHPGATQYTSGSIKPEGNLGDGLLREVIDISRQAREGAMKEFEQFQQKKHNLGRVGTASESNRSVLLSSKGFKGGEIKNHHMSKSQLKFSGFEPNTNFHSSQDTPPKALRNFKPTNFSTVDYSKEGYEESNTPKSIGIKKMKPNYSQIVGNKNDRSNILSQQESRAFIIRENKHEYDESLSPVASKLKKCVNSNGFKGFNEGNFGLKKEGSYSKNLLKTVEDSQTYAIPLNGIVLLPGALDTSERERPPADWKEALNKKLAHFEPALDIKSSKLPGSYCNVSPKFAFYQSKQENMNNVLSVRNLSQGSTDMLFGSPRTPKTGGNRSVRNYGTSSPKTTNLITPIKFSVSPVSRIHTTAPGKRNEKILPSKSISVTGLTMPAIVKSKLASRTHTQSQSRVKTDKDLMTES